MQLKISQKSLEVIANLIEKRGNDNPTTYYTDLSAYIPAELLSTHEKVLLPHVLLWDPLTKLPTCVNLKCPHCVQDHPEEPSSYVEIVGTQNWQMKSKHSLPRAIWDRGWYCALVGRLYTCQRRQHKLMSYHLGFLQQIPINQVPFILTHMTGITMSGYDEIVRLIENNMNFLNIENALGCTMAENYQRRKQSHPHVAFDETFKIPMISSTLIRKFFLDQFNVNKPIYQQRFDTIKSRQLHFVTNTSHFDVNVGYMKDSRWLRVFDRLFLIFNETGHVSAYGFGTLNEQAAELITSIAERNPQVELVLFDSNCCSFREAFSEVYPDALVKCDIYHAVQDLKEEIPNDRQHEDVRRAVELLFRTPEDSGKENQRKFHTPEPDVLLGNIESFITRWNDGSNNQKPLLSSNALFEMEKLKIHAANGCLSGIPPTTPCDRNKEKVLNKLKSVFESDNNKAKRLTVETCCAMVTHLLYVQNCLRDGQSIYKPIWYYRDPDVLGTNYQQLDYKTDGNETSNGAIQSSGVESSFLEQFNSTSDDCDDVSAKYLLTLKVTTLFNELHSRFERLPNTRQHSFRPFIGVSAEVWYVTKYLDVCRSRASLLKVEQAALHSVLGLEVVMELSNEYTIFSSVWHCLRDILDNTNAPSSLKSIVENKGLSRPTGNATEMIKCLYDLTVKEISGAHKEFYLTFVDNDDKNLDVTLPQDGAVSIEMQAVFVHALCNLLGITLVLIPTCRIVPILPVLPHYELEYDVPLFLHVENDDDGTLRFKALVNSRVMNSPSKTVALFCRCGVHSNTKKKKSSGKTTRCCNMKCRCILTARKCSEHCKCENCGNGKPDVVPIDGQNADEPKCEQRKRRSRSYKQTETLKETLEASFVETSISETPTHEETIPPLTDEIREESTTTVTLPEKIPDIRNVVFEAILFIVSVEMKRRQKDFDDGELASILSSHYIEFYEELKDNQELTRHEFLAPLNEIQEHDKCFLEWLCERRKTFDAVLSIRIENEQPVEQLQKPVEEAHKPAEEAKKPKRKKIC